MAEIWKWIVCHWQELCIFGALVLLAYKVARPVERFIAGLNRKLDTLAKCNDDRAEDIVVMVKGLTACLDGLSQQGVNGPVTIARKDLQDDLYKRLGQVEGR
jgi:hypothetical protein